MRHLRRFVAALAVSAVLVQPVAAQDRNTLPELEQLIPDSAVDNPEDWAKQGVPSEAVPQPDVQPDTPLADLPLITVPWPEQLELPQLAPLTPEPDIQFAEPEAPLPQLREGEEVRLSSELLLVFPNEAAQFPEREAFVRRFKQLSTIEQYDDNGSAARLAAQARQDQDLLERMLRVYGYYDALVMRNVSVGDREQTKAARPTVRFDILPGKQYAVGAIDLGGLAAAGPDYPMLRSAFEIQSGDPLLQDKIDSERADLDTALGESGYPFAAIADPELLIDHARDQGDLTMLVTPGGKYRFGKVTSNLPDFLSGKHLAEIARFDSGDLYQRSLELDLRQAIQATGLVATSKLTPVEVTPPSNGQPGTVDIAVEMTKAKLRTIIGQIGYGTGEGFKAEGSWEHRNLFPPEGALKVRGIAGTREQLAGVTFRRNNFHGRDKVLTVDAFASTLDYDAYDARTVSLVGSLERLSTLLYQKKFSWSLGVELTATGERQATASGSGVNNFGPRQTYFIGAIPLYGQFDTSDDLLNPTKGYRLSAHVSPETSRTNKDQSFYVRAQGDASYYYSVSDRIVLAARVRLASIPGAPLSAIAPSRRLYAGGGGSVRGYGYQSIGPHDSQGDPTGGRSLVELSAEARIQTPWLGGALGIVPFVDAGTVGSSSTPSFNEIKLGAGIGVRYLTGFGPIRVDVGVPLNPGPGDGPVGVYVALGQAF
uniref:autotransporter assembly complex protein TamA n=1 Tax=Altererythrobacter segetis TaxID=1104773 RepID=UPI001409AB8E|nr:BamA/TamA family outer membrane protein [Altererythrobacter segetis]